MMELGFVAVWWQVSRTVANGRNYIFGCSSAKKCLTDHVPLSVYDVLVLAWKCRLKNIHIGTSPTMLLFYLQKCFIF